MSSSSGADMATRMHDSVSTSTASWSGGAAAIGAHTSPAASAHAPIRVVRAAISRA
ncbi:hypothetical protein ABZV81_34005 [Streptomyces parvus]|uniref:hypothetical protein n=1 Tax=Streptomyces parvus TaxID=66428 RepID=UPI0033A9978B